MLRRATTCNNFSHSRVWVEALCISVKFAAGLILVVAGSIGVPLAGGTVDFGVGMPTEVLVTAEIVAMIASEAVVPVSHGINVRSGAMIGMLTVTVIRVVPFSGMGVLTGADANMLTATMTAFVSVPMLASSKEALAFGSGASSCWPATA